MRSFQSPKVIFRCCVILALLAINLLITTSMFGQDCDCDPVVEVDVCYLDRDVYCLGDAAASFNCGMTFDHPNFREGILLKLQNQNNFGINGIIECAINVVPLTDVSSKDDIYNSGCEVFYVGHYPDSQNFEITSLSSQTLDAIYQWSTDCPRNLAIIPQVEARRWGYTIENLNQNPNQMSQGVNSVFALFDGPFGPVVDFNQGGSYQGVITETPETGHLILAQDAAGLPTVAFDLESSDLIIGDVGFFASNTQGSVSEGGSVVNNNDRFACNVFALACNLVDEFLYVNTTLRLCIGDTYLLPNGESTQLPGSYLDTIVEPEACDSIINTILFFDFFEDYDTLLLIDLVSGNSAFDLGLDRTDVSNIEWMPSEGLSCNDCLTPSVDPTLNIQNYQAVITNKQGCTFTIFVEVDYLNPPFIPNILSPISIGVDQYFQIGLADNLYQYGVEIQDFALYDRWGSLIKSLSRQPLMKDMPLWDGTFNGGPSESGVYIYTFQLNYPNGESYPFVGDITLLR